MRALLNSDQPAATAMAITLLETLAKAVTQDLKQIRDVLGLVVNKDDPR